MDPQDDALQARNAASVIRESDIDLWALQEISSASAFARLLQELGDDYEGRLTGVGSSLNLAFVYRPDRIRLRRIQNVLTSFSSAFAGRPPLKIEFDVLLPDTTITLTAFTVHMKARSDAASYERRLEASGRLKDHIDFTLSGKPVLVAGDFNDELTQSITSGRTSPYLNFLSDPNYRFLTAEMEANNVGTFCGSSLSCNSASTIDHLLVTAAVSEGATIDAGRLEGALAAIDRFVFTTSDHIPVYASITFARGTSTARERHALDLSERLLAFPNPGGRHITLDTPGPGALRLVDVLGRTVASWREESSRAGFDTERLNLAPGLYQILWSAGSKRAGRTIVIR